jgi:hypothetical protein
MEWESRLDTAIIGAGRNDGIDSLREYWHASLVDLCSICIYVFVQALSCAETTIEGGFEFVQEASCRVSELATFLMRLCPFLTIAACITYNQPTRLNRIVFLWMIILQE